MTSSTSNPPHADISYRPLSQIHKPIIAKTRPPQHTPTMPVTTSDPPVASPDTIALQIDAIEPRDENTTTSDPEASEPATSHPASRSSSHLSVIYRVHSNGDANWDEEGEQCRICHCATPAPNESGDHEPMITPCSCSGSLKYVHQTCLQQWIKSADTRSCELCKYNFHMTTKLKPFRKWKYLEMTSMERRKIMCSVTFHAIAITCVVWSLYVLIDRTSDEIKNGSLQWPFWTKLVVVAIGFTGGLVFMYVQCQTYAQLCKRWRAFNRIVYVQNAPAKNAKPGTDSNNKTTSNESAGGGDDKVDGKGITSLDEIEVL